MKKFYTFIFAFLILILSGFIFIKTINATHDPNYPPCGHNYLQGSFFSNNQSNIIWQVGFRVIYNYNQPGKEENGVVWKDLVDYTTCSSGNRCVFIDTKQLRNDDAWKPYRLQWGTGCIDPIVKPDPVEEARSCNEWYVFNGQNVTMSRTNLENLGIPTSSGSYNYLDDIAWFEDHGGKTIHFGGLGNIDNCPRAPRYSIDGHVYVDKNRDGNWDPNGQNGSPNEPAYQGAIIRKTGDGNPEPDTTGNNGYYRFYNLPSGGNYKVEFTNKPSGYSFTKPTDGTWTGIDLPPNHTVANGNPFNFGIALSNGPIGGRVYIDKNGSNNFDPGEGYTGATVFKDKGTNNQEKRISDPDYNFGGLTGGSTHDIKLEDFPAARLNVEGDNPKRNVRVPNTNANFRLNFQKYTIRGHVYWDPDGNGISTTPYSKTVDLKVVGEGRNDTTNDDGAYTINGNPTDLTADGKKYTLRLTNQRGGDIVKGGRDRPVTIKDKDEVENFFVTRNAIPTYSLSGGVFIDTDPIGERNAEGYTTPLNPEQITINGIPLNAANFPESSFNENGFYVPGRSAGVYDVEFPLPIRQNNYVVSFHPGRYRVTIGPGCSPADLCEGEDGANLDFGISQTVQQVSWFQGVGGYMRDDHSGSVTIPSGKFLSITSPTLTSPGVVFNFNLSSGNVSSKGWRVKNSTYRVGVIKTSFDYITDALKKGKATQYNLFGTGAHCGPDDGSGCRIDNPNGGYYYTNGKNVTLDAIDFRADQDYIFRIDGNLTINTGATPWNVPNSTSVMFVVSGNIIVNNDVTHLEGIFSADGDFRVNSKAPADDSQLIIEGSVIANAKRNSANTKPFDNKRDLGDSNNTTPSVKIIYRPDFVLNAPNIVRYSNYNFQEVAPSGQ